MPTGLGTITDHVVPGCILRSGADDHGTLEERREWLRCVGLVLSVLMFHHNVLVTSSLLLLVAYCYY